MLRRGWHFLYRAMALPEFVIALRMGLRGLSRNASETVIPDRQIVEHIGKLPKRTAGFKQLVKELGLRGGERSELHERLKKLLDRGELVELERDRFSLPIAAQDRNMVAGTLSMHRDGFGFVTPDDPQIKAKIEGDIFIPPDAVGQAMHGDRVMVTLSRQPRTGERMEGRIGKVQRRAHNTVVGTFHYSERYNYIEPFDEKMRQIVIIPAGQEYPEEKPREDKRHRESRHRVIGDEARRRTEYDDLEGVVVDVEITQWPSATQNARGRVIAVLGDEEDFSVDVEIIIRKHHIPHRFPEEVLQEAQEIPATIAHRELARRQDYRDLPIVTIDGETARDFDDAVLVTPLPNGNYELQVHIADVAQYVREGTALDHEARTRGTSVYFPDRAVPMLPLELSTDICSLRPQVDRLVLSCLMEFDRKGELQRYEINEGIIRSAARMTYNEVQAVFDGDANIAKKYAGLVENFLQMKELAEILNRKRVRRGSIDFDLPEAQIDFNPETGLMQGVTRSERLFAHRLIEEFMLAANECVATHLDAHEVASLYRIHEMPDPKKIYDFELLAASFGYSLGVDIAVRRVQTKTDRRARYGTGNRAPAVELPQQVHVSPRMYQKLTQQIAGKPEERILSYLMLRSLKQARYSEKNEGHFALAAPTYTHFTSPIRRYPDLIVHRILKAVLNESSDDELAGGHREIGHAAALSPWKKAHEHTHGGRKQQPQQNEERSGPIPEPLLHDIAEQSSITERRADDAERELIEWKKIKFMRDKVGAEFEALVTSVTKFGLFVELEELFVEGLVPVHTLPGGDFRFRESTRQMSNENGSRVYSIGDRVHVVLDRIDRMQRKLQFAILEEMPAEAPRRKRKKKNKALAKASPEERKQARTERRKRLREERRQKRGSHKRH
jgi:ribonuclease R